MNEDIVITSFFKQRTFLSSSEELYCAKSGDMMISKSVSFFESVAFLFHNFVTILKLNCNRVDLRIKFNVVSLYELLFDLVKEFFKTGVTIYALDCKVSEPFCTNCVDLINLFFFKISFQVKVKVVSVKINIKN